LQSAWTSVTRGVSQFLRKGGDNLARLQAIKRRYDPHGRFEFAQGVTG
jgi:FAD/FMN-containing dehydrogenase